MGELNDNLRLKSTVCWMWDCEKMGGDLDLGKMSLGLIRPNFRLATAANDQAYVGQIRLRSK